MNERFSVFPQFEDPHLAGMIRSRHRLGDIASTVFTGDRVHDRLVRALCAERLLNTKEVLESFEFHRVVRRRVRRSVMADLACGHGLTGILFALMERTVDHVHLVDHRRPESVSKVLEVACSLAPWLRSKITYHETDLKDLTLPNDTGIIGVHACGAQTDRVLDVALDVQGPVAVMPCCYRTAPHRGPVGIADALGRAMSIDIHRSYRLHEHGLRTDWAAIPVAITPMNRILIGWRERGSSNHSTR